MGIGELGSGREADGNEYDLVQNEIEREVEGGRIEREEGERECTHTRERERERERESERERERD